LPRWCAAASELKKSFCFFFQKEALSFFFFCAWPARNLLQAVLF
jgi:hypothetical protein